MRIYIPTHRRPAQTTFWALPPALRAQTTLVTDWSDAETPIFKKNIAEAGGSVRVIPENVKGIAAKRQYIMDNAEERYIVMIDDDLKFVTKLPPDRRMRGATAEQTEVMFANLERWLKDDGFAHCGLTTRFLNWQSPGPYIETSRMMHVLAYDREKVSACGASFIKNVPDELLATFDVEDFHMTLQLFEAGYKNRIDVDNCSSPGKSNEKGGCSSWRTPATHAEGVLFLKWQHPEFVKVVEKKTKGGWGADETTGGLRTDVVVQWRKAYESSQRK